MPKAKKLPSGNWRCQVYVGKVNGKNKYESVTAPTKKEAEYLAGELAYKYKKQNNNDLTLGEAYDKYIESKSNVLSPNTVREYKRSRKHDLQELMDIKISHLTQEAVQKAINEYTLNHSPKSVRNVHGLLSAVLSVYAPEFKLHTTLPQKEHYDRQIPTEDDVEKLLKIAAGTKYEVPILLAALGSLRRGEISALKPEDVTDKGIWVKKAIAYDEDYKEVVKAPKSFKRYRFVEMPEYVIAKLREWDFDISPNTITKGFARLVKKSGIPHCRFHDLRHFHASVAHALGIPDKYIMERGGWSSAQVLQDVYQHTMRDKEKEFADKINDHFNRFKDDDDAENV